jgi:hypothetical protein
MAMKHRNEDGVLVVKFSAVQGAAFKDTPTFVAVFEKIRIDNELDDKTKENLIKAKEAIAKIRGSLLTVEGTPEDNLKAKFLGHRDYPRILYNYATSAKTAQHVPSERPVVDAEDVVPF